jgi:UDP-GlcNAc:undecaprenyl-phosphate GlcNAc-1-phosphate transferase
MLIAAFAVALLLDHPEARKLHTAATALLGGLVVAVCAVAGWLVALRFDQRLAAPGPSMGWLVAGAAVCLVLGLWDDRFGMGVRLKLFGQLLAGACLLAAGVVPDTSWTWWLAVPLTLFGLVALLNAVNFLDNMNGMIGGWTGVAMLGFAWGSAARGAWGIAAAQLAIAGACAGFLPYNFPKARIFLGDAGSLFLGYSLGASAVLAFAGAPAGWGRVGTLAALAYPAFDIIFVVVTRLADGRKVQQGGKDHSNHRLARLIQCPTRTVMLLWLSGAVLCASGLVVQSLDRPLPTLLWLALWTGLFLWMGRRLSSVPSGA